MEPNSEGNSSSSTPNDVATKSGYDLKILGWLLVIVSPGPCIGVAVLLFRNWARLGEANSPLWVLALVVLCFVACTAVFLCVGSGLLSGRSKLVSSGAWLFAGTLTTYLTLFAIFD